MATVREIYQYLADWPRFLYKWSLTTPVFW